LLYEPTNCLPSQGFAVTSSVDWAVLFTSGRVPYSCTPRVGPSLYDLTFRPLYHGQNVPAATVHRAR